MFSFLKSAVAGASLLWFAGVPAANAELLYATNGMAISRFDSAALGTVTTVPVTGLQAGETLVGIDARPSTGVLYGIGSTSRVYTINPITGLATQLGTSGQFTLNGTAFGTDFNPAADRIRQVSNTEQSFRINPNDGNLAATDTALNPAGNIVAVAYDRNDNSAVTATTLFAIDSAAGTLALIGGVNGSPSPNGGAITTVGSLGLGTNLNEAIGFDIAFSGTAFATITTGGISRLYTINLSTGAATLLGQIGTGTTPFLGVTSAEVAPAFGTSLLFKTGDAVPGQPAGTEFIDFGLPALDGTRVGFLANIRNEDSRRQVIMGGASIGVLLTAGEGGSPAPGTSSDFASFLEAVFANARYAALAKLKPGDGVTPASDEGIWSDSTGVLHMVAREGDAAPDANEAKFQSFLSLAFPGSGGPAFVARLKAGTGSAGNKVTGATDMGLWRENAGVTRLIIREGMEVTVNAVQRKVKSFQALGLIPGSEDQRRSHRSNGELLILATFTDGTQAILRNTVASTALVVDVTSEDIVNAPAGARVRQLGVPAAGAFTSAFLGLLKVEGSITAANDAGVFHRTGGLATARAQEGSPAAEADNGLFKAFGNPLATQGNVTIFTATTRAGTGVPRTRADNDTGLWLDTNGTLDLVARESFSAPGTPGGFGRFLSVAAHPDVFPIRALAFTAQLQNGVGGVKGSNNLGLWARAQTGEVILIQRTGDVLVLGPDDEVAVTKIDALKASPRSAGQGRALNTTGQVVFRSTLGKRGQAVFLSQLP